VVIYFTRRAFEIGSVLEIHIVFVEKQKYL
jgi:hypothetical protein